LGENAVTVKFNFGYPPQTPLCELIALIRSRSWSGKWKGKRKVGRGNKGRKGVWKREKGRNGKGGREWIRRRGICSMKQGERPT